MEGEVLFWKVFRNIVLKKCILKEIKSQRNIYSSNKWLLLGDRIDYNNIVSLGWMIERSQYSMIKDKLLSNNYIHITSDSILLLIQKCISEEIYQILFEKRREDLERVDLILESINYESVFALSTFIKLYGGIDQVIIRYNEYSLLDYAIKHSKVKIANYLFQQQNNYGKFTESKLIKNSLLFDPPSKEKDYHYNDFSKSNKSLTELNCLHNFFIKRAKGSLSDTSRQIRSISSSLKIPFSKINMAKIVEPPENIKENMMEIMYRSKLLKISSFNFRENEKLKFIENQLELKVANLIEKYKDDKTTFPSLFIKNISFNQLWLIFKNGYYVKDYHIIKSKPPLSDDHLFSNVPRFQPNYDLDFIKYILCIAKFNNLISRGNYNHGSLESTKNTDFHGLPKEKFNEFMIKIETILNSSAPIDQLIESNFRFLIVYFMDFKFYQGKNGLKEIEDRSYDFFANDYKLIPILFSSTDAMFILYNLSILNFSIDGINLFIKLYQDRFRHSKINELIEFINPELFDKSKFQSLISINNTTESNHLISFFNQLEELAKKQQTSVQPYGLFKTLKPVFQVPWSILIEILIKWFDSSVLIGLIENCQFFRDNVSSYFSHFLIPNQVNGKIDFVKLDLYFKNFKIEDFKLHSYYNCCDSAYGLNSFFKICGKNSLEEKIKLINYLSNNPHFVSLNARKLFYKLFNELFFNNLVFQTSVEDTMLIQELIDLYSRFNTDLLYKSKLFKYTDQDDSEINCFSIGNFVLENYFLDQLLKNSILNSDLNLVIKILSAVNKNSCSIEIQTTSTIKLVEYLFENKLLDRFGSNFIKLLLKSLFKNNDAFTNIELEMVKMVQIILKSINNESSIADYIFKLSYDNQYFIIVSFLYSNKLIGEKMEEEFNSFFSINKSDCITINERYNQINDGVKLICNDNLKVSHSDYLFNIESMVNYYQNVTTSKNFGEKNYASLIEILNLSTQYCNLDTFIEIHTNVLQKFNLLFKHLVCFAVIYHRVDIIKYIFETIEVTKSHYSLFLEAITYGDIQIANYLFKEQTQLFNETASIHSEGKGSLLNNVCKRALINGHVGLFKSLLEIFPNFKFDINRDIINKTIKNGYYNVIQYLYSIGKLINLDYITTLKITDISEEGKFSIEITNHFSSIILDVIKMQQKDSSKIYNLENKQVSAIVTRGKRSTPEETKEIASTVPKPIISTRKRSTIPTTTETTTTQRSAMSTRKRTLEEATTTQPTTTNKKKK